MRKLQPDDYRESDLYLFSMIHSGLFNRLQAVRVVIVFLNKHILSSRINYFFKY